MKRRSKKIKNLFSGLFYIIATLFFLGVFLVAVSFIYFARDLPRPENFTSRTIVQPTRIYDRTGEHLLYTMHGEERRNLIDSVEDVPDHLVHALLAAEDTRFYEHHGIDIEGIGRAILINLKERSLAAGGSTISQQLIRSSLLTNEKTFMRKIREIILTIELERKYSKNEIIKFYLNQVPFGHNIYGIETAAQSFFNKSASELSLAESATLIAIIRSPSALSPYGDNLEALIGRRNYIINRMANLGYISELERSAGVTEEPEFSSFTNYLRAPHFVLHVKAKLEETYGTEFLNKNGLKIYTTVNFEMQRKAEGIAKIFADRNSKKYNAHNIAIVVIDPNTGEVLSMVGSADYFGEKYPSECIPGKSCLFDPYTNVALRERQPGSAFKPFVYAEAFRNGYNGNTTVIDEKTNFGTPSNPYIPKNYDGRYRGEVTLREALAQSLNIPAVKVLAEMAGLKSSIETAKKFGITTFTKDPYFYGLALVLGGGEVKLLELTSAYGVFATGGLRSPNSFILKIENSDGETIFKNNSTPRKIIKDEIAKEITDILSDNKARAPVFGPNSVLHFKNNKVAVKTGSTQSFRDGWTLGYTPDVAIGVWAGNNNNQRMINAPGISVAAPAWRVLMEEFINN